MADERQSDNVEKLLSDEKAIEDRKQALIAELLKQKEAAMKEFDAKLTKLGHETNSSGRAKRSHHRKATPPEAAKPKTKA
jgi:hypothetical protein